MVATMAWMDIKWENNCRRVYYFKIAWALIAAFIIDVWKYLGRPFCSLLVKTLFPHGPPEHHAYSSPLVVHRWRN